MMMTPIEKNEALIKYRSELRQIIEVTQLQINTAQPIIQDLQRKIKKLEGES
jgi:hypothetical protein